MSYSAIAQFVTVKTKKEVKEDGANDPLLVPPRRAGNVTISSNLEVEGDLRVQGTFIGISGGTEERPLTERIETTGNGIYVTPNILDSSNITISLEDNIPQTAYIDVITSYTTSSNVDMQAGSHMFQPAQGAAPGIIHWRATCVGQGVITIKMNGIVQTEIPISAPTAENWPMSETVYNGSIMEPQFSTPHYTIETRATQDTFTINQMTLVRYA